jgi:hypothetical protein
MVNDFRLNKKDPKLGILVAIEPLSAALLYVRTPF